MSTSSSNFRSVVFSISGDYSTFQPFNLNISDFIKVAKEISELSKKLYTLYDDEEFYKIYKMFDNKLIQKTMS